ncbi:glucose-1-phosphate cytidylyltransferase [Dissulfurispira thermophila]|uniref:Glucose-1-phosphate cytidylyltransferase n=2 Tax=root TaxID=1 RepID=A0A7G1H130_9BACT|nr:glucose-1-phosphate cytidylyltransferase [Dissulfurispira thermophila]BCB96308.1 glucose-1-phosphate cytidylyltransferase [Dissulfurispira thermophila]
MKTVILCGGLGTRLSEETHLKPKPMVEIGEKPILWHIMNIYSAHGFNEFILALGYKGEAVKKYFLNYYNFQSDLTISLKTGKITASKNCYRDWIVHLIDTGLNSMTGGRLYRLRDKLKNETFMLTYGDGVSNVDIKKLVQFHKSHGKIATVTAVKPSARFGGMKFNGDRVIEFTEKPQTGEGWINGGFFVFEKAIFDYLKGDETVLEKEPMENLAKDGQLMAYKHEGFWQCMDTLRDKQLLESLWENEKAPWKIWKD